ncbi:MAG: hypothetical protein WBX15_02520 [Thermoanaerobaculia bacterium]
MKKYVILSALLILSGIPAFAQQNALGFSAGSGESMKNGFDLKLDNPVKEIFFETEMEPGTTFTIKLGRVNSDKIVEVGNATPSGDLDFVDALVEYRFDEIYGRTSFFAGPGFYRFKGNGNDFSDWGLSGGVNAIFPLTRRLGIKAELAYHWVNFDQKAKFLTATGGIRMAF